MNTCDRARYAGGGGVKKKQKNPEFQKIVFFYYIKAKIFQGGQ